MALAWAALAAPGCAVFAPPEPFGDGANAALLAPGAGAFALQVEAPETVRPYLERHLELQRYRPLTDLDASELAQLVDDAEGNARELLGTLGYFSPEIAFEILQPASARPTVRLSVQVGAAARITSIAIDFSGPIAADPRSAAQRDAIHAAWGLHTGQRFTQARWDSAKAQALRQLTAQRYPLGRISASHAEIDGESAAVRLSLTLDSGPAYRLGALQVSGAARHDPLLVQRLSLLVSGSDYDQARLLEAQQRLGDSGYFDSVFVSLDTSGEADAAPVKIELREARTQKLVLGVGASTDTGARLSAEHTHHKLPGLGVRALSKLALEREAQSVGTELTAPPDGDNWRWVTSALLQRQDSNGLDVHSQRYRVGRTQHGVAQDRTYYLQYDRAGSRSASALTRADALAANYAWTRRDFDSLLFPQRGSGLGVELGAGVTLGDSKQPYLRTQARWLGYVPLGRAGAGPDGAAPAGRIALRAEGGAVLARAAAALPSTQLFLTGGDKSVRGYGYRDIGVVQPDGQLAAGRYLAVGSVEWQRPIAFGGVPSSWEGTLFADAGAVADRPAELRAKVGVGAGVRWQSPVGPLQMDLAYGVALRRARLHLSVGFSF